MAGYVSRRLRRSARVNGVVRSARCSAIRVTNWCECSSGGAWGVTSSQARTPIARLAGGAGRDGFGSD